jgi:hypothetical protein
MVRPQAFVYSIHGYGDVTANGMPKTTARLTNATTPDGIVMNFGTVGPVQEGNPIPPKIGCGDVPRNGYHMCGIFAGGSNLRTFDFRNAGRSVPDFILQLHSFKWWTLRGVSASMDRGSAPRLLAPRRLAPHPYVYTLGFGPLPHGASLHIILATAPTSKNGFRDEVSAFGTLTRAGVPDPRSLIFKGFPINR